MNIYFKGEIITRAEANAIVGETVMAARIAEAKQAYEEDPLEESSWMDGMVIEA